MAEATPPRPDERQIIHGYGDSGFRVASTLHRGSVIVFPERTLPWSAIAFEDVTEASLAPVFAAQGSLDLLLVGCGAALRPIGAELRAALRRAGIAVESMDTGAACRTFNVLIAEERRVAAALIAVV